MLLKFNNPSQTIAYSHYAARKIKISQKPPGITHYVRVWINLYDSDKVLTSKGVNSTFVNLIHAIDSRVLKLSRNILKKEYSIDTHGIHDCFLCNLKDAGIVIRVYNQQLMENNKLNIENILEGYTYPEEVRKALRDIKNIEWHPSPYSLMPT